MELASTLLEVSDVLVITAMSRAAQNKCVWMSTNVFELHLHAVLIVRTQWEDTNVFAQLDINWIVTIVLALILMSVPRSNITANTCASTQLVHSNVNAHTDSWRRDNNVWTATNVWTHRISAVDVVSAEMTQAAIIANAHVVTEWTMLVVPVLMLMSA